MTSSAISRMNSELVLQPNDHTTSYDETCPLLSNSVTSSLESQNASHELNKTKAVTPLPKAQLSCLCIVRLVDPIAFTHIFPYVNEMMADLHVTDDPSRIGFYSGLVESSFALFQLISIYQWARLSDIIGRRPVIFLGITGMAIASILFGLSQSLTCVLLIRCFAGLFSGNVAVIHSVLGELTDSTNQAIAFPIYGLTWPLGSIVGPLIGGTFSNPAAKFPDLFDNTFFRTYPYFLPGFIAAAISFTGVIFGYFFLEETLPSRRRKSDAMSSSSMSDITSKASCMRSEPLNVKSLLAIPIIRALSLSGCALSFISTAFDVVFVLFCYSPIESGGLAFSASQIGYCLATSGVISIFIQILIMPTVLARCDHARVYNFCMALWPYVFCVIPLLNIIARTGFPEQLGPGMILQNADARVQATVWCCIAALLGITRIATLAFSVSMILVKESAPTPASLGVTNGLVQFFMCFARAFSPAFVSSLFALSLDFNILGGYLWVLIMVVISILAASLARSIEKGRKVTSANGYD
ncbi:hypothetical protein EW146_g974 [Bondarzewia mesenterica]|uniref:Major facilitator superfamily (MFS) profile domain-containing protein n=1 Tax=Bondarzewia mesenterica TaxID=1095465 RepID=A0A4S4M5A6_9AGAM|nr:hypothetical protein EW146_g974 [Bondarzewia mesenterica]